VLQCTLLLSGTLRPHKIVSCIPQSLFQYFWLVTMLQKNEKKFLCFSRGPLFVGAPVRLNMPKSACFFSVWHPCASLIWLVGCLTSIVMSRPMKSVSYNSHSCFSMLLLYIISGTLSKFYQYNRHCLCHYPVLPIPGQCSTPGS